MCPTFLSLELYLDGLLVNATCVLKSAIPPEGGGRTGGKVSLQARAASATVSAATDTWDERLVTNWWLGTLG